MADRSGDRHRYRWSLLLVVAAVVVVWVLLDGGRQSDPDLRPDPGGLPVVQVADLPPEAARILELIDAGGPFDEDRDGAIFENREDLLPDHPTGYYREYTVPTPGSDDRGARRIVAGEGGELYYTGDHYSSFSRIARTSS